MVALWLAEMRRIAARRVVRLTLVLTLAGIVIGGVAAFALSGSLSEESYQQRVTAAEEERSAAEEEIEACFRAQGVAGDEEISSEVADVCLPDDGFGEVSDPRFHRTRLEGILKGVGAVLAVLGWAFGASLVGAEFVSRGMTTLLTWEPRRSRVFAAKTLAVLVAMSVFALVVLALVTLAMAPALALHGSPLRANDPTVASLVGAIGRGVALATLSSAIGLAIATIGRSTASALGAGFAYVIVLEYVLGSTVERWRRWLLLGNVIVLVSGQDSAADVSGRSVTAAAVFLTAVAVTLLVAAAGTFRIRDVA